MDEAAQARKFNGILAGPDGKLSSRRVNDQTRELTPRLISEGYKAQQEHLHETTEYGTAAEGFGPLISQIVERLGVSHLLDYGCGRRMSLLRTLKAKAKLTYQGYDPCSGVEELASAPVPAQLVCCIDVLEHIEPEYLDNVLDHLASLTEIVAFLSIHTGPASKILQDGRNAHLTQKEMDWWLPKLWSRWDIQTVQKTHEHGFYVIAYSKPRLEAVNGSKIVVGETWP